MKPVLVQASKAINQRILAAHTSDGQERFSALPAVFETDFWDNVFAFAKDRETARGVLIQLSEIEQQPCAEESDRVMRCIATARQIAQRTLRALH